jgi:hypothetical protein|uniref:DUF659 domain-containing protein n=1 Tax=Sipha flava TaxID=143950 RepID=A0A2S2Q283_9HEMI
MPKVPNAKLASIRKWINPYNISGEVFKVLNNTTVFCQHCQKPVKAEKKFQIDQHTKSFFHEQFLNKSSSKQTFVREASRSIENQSQFFKEFCSTLISSNILLHKIQNKNFKSFLEKYTNTHIPDESTLRKNYLNQCYTDVLQNIREYIGSSYIFFSIDETTDPRGKYIANFTVGKLNADSPSKSYLLTSKVLEKTNNSTIAQFVNNSLKLLWPEGNNDDKVLLMLSDAAPYMTKAAQNLKPFYSNLVHVTCVAHDIHRIAEKIIDSFRDINDLIYNGKKVFSKAPYRIQLYKEMLPNTPLPPKPIITRWVTWLESAFFYADHFEEFKNVIENLEDDAKSIQNCKSILNKLHVKYDLAYIRKHFLCIVESIKKLETSNLSLVDSLKIVEQVENSVNELPTNENSLIIKTKCKNVLNKNKGLMIFKKISNILQSDSANFNDLSVSNYSPDILANFKYAPITCVDVERSFSSYKYILTDLHHSFTEINMEHTLITYCFSN